MLLGVSRYMVKQVEHLVFLVLEVIGVASELALDLELPAEERGVPSVREWDWVWQFL